MKKLLTATLAIAMGATIVGAVAGCNNNKPNTPTDEETAEKAIGIIRTLYYDKSKETAADYTVVGKVNVDGTVYDVDWTVIPDATCTVENFSNYVSLSELNTETDQYTVSISNAEVVIEYTLKASVTVGKATKSIEFSRSVPKGKDITNIDKQKALLTVGSDTSVSASGEQQVFKNDGITFTKDKYNSSSAVNPTYPERCYQGSKVSIEYPGILQLKLTSDKPYTDDSGKVTDYPNLLKASIEAAGYPGVTVTVDEENLIVTVDFETPVECLEFVAKTQVRIKEINVTGVKGGATDEQKVSVANAMLDLDTKEYSAAGTYDLLAKKNGASVTWAVKETSEYVSIASGKLVVGKMPTSETSVVLVATITSGNESATKEFTVKLTPIEGVTHAGTQADPYLPSEAIIVAKRLESGAYSSTVYVKGYVIAPGTYNSQFGNFDNMYIADTYAEDKATTAADALYVFRPSPDGTYLTTAGFNKGDLVTFEGKLQNYQGKTMELTGGKCVARQEVVDERTDAEKAQAALDALTIPSTVKGNLTLTSSVTGVTLSITNSTNTDAIALNGTVTRGDADVQVTITVTATIGSEHPTKDFTVTVKAAATTFEAGTYKLALQQVSLGKKLYFAGEINSSGYGTTTENEMQAASVEVEVAENGYTFKVGEKYLELYLNSDNKPRLTLVDTATGAWTYDSDLEVFTWTLSNTAYYLGTYSTYNTISASSTSFISGNNAGNVGVSQFPAGFEKVTEKSDAEKVEAAKDAVTLTGNYAAGTVTLPSESGDTTLSWSSESSIVSIADDGVTMTITAPEEDTDVTLTVTITCGDESDTKDITIKVLKASTKGTQDDPYTAAEVADIANGLASGTYYSENGAPKKVYVKGYITVLGTYNSGSSRYNNMYIADVAGTAKDGSLNVYTLSLKEGTVLENEGDLKVGDLVILYGYIENFNGTPEITYYGSGDDSAVLAVAKLQDQRPEEEKGQQALDALNIPEEVTNDIVLESVVGDVTLGIKSSTNESAIALNGKVTRTTSDVEVTIVVAAYVDEEEVATKEFAVTVKQILIVTQSVNATLEFDSAKANNVAASTNTNQQVWAANGITFTNLKSSSTTNVAVYSPVRCYKGSSIKIECSAIDTIIFNCETFTSGSNTVDSASELVKSIGTQAGVSVSVAGKIVTVTFEYPCTEFTIDELTSQVRFTSIQVKAAANQIAITGTDAEKVAAAKEEAEATIQESYEAGVYTLPLKSNGATLEWEVTPATQLVTIEGATMTVAEPDEDTVVKVTVTITSGTVTETKELSFTVKAPAPVVETNYGTLETPITVTAANAIAAELGKDEWTAQVVYMKGIAASTAAISSNGQYYQTFSIADENDSTKTITVYSINLRSDVAAPVQNDVVVVSGYITNYNGNKIQFSRRTVDSSTTEVYLENNTRGTSTITLGAHEGATVTGDLSETATTVTKTNGTEVTFTVTVADNKELVSVKVGTKTIEDTDGTYKFTVAGNMTVTVDTIDAGAKPNSIAKIDYSTSGYSNAQTLDGVAVKADDNASVTFKKGTGSSAPAYYDTGTSARAYGGNTITVSVPTGYVIVKITFTFGSGDTSSKALTADKGTFATDTWTGSEQTIVLTAASGGGHRRIKAIEVEYKAVSNSETATVAEALPATYSDGKEY